MGYSWTERTEDIDRIVTQEGKDLDSCIQAVYTKLESSGKISNSYSTGSTVIKNFYSEVSNHISTLNSMNKCVPVYAAKEVTVYTSAHKSSVSSCSTNNTSVNSSKHSSCYGHDSSDYSSCDSDRSSNYSSCDSNQSSYGQCCSHYSPQG